METVARHVVDALKRSRVVNLSRDAIPPSWNDLDTGTLSTPKHT
jgi:hypothetical protein